MGWIIAAWVLGMLALVMPEVDRLSRVEWLTLLAWPLAVPVAQVIMWRRRRKAQR